LKIFKLSLTTFVTRTFLAGISFITGLIILKKLQPDGSGIYSLAVLIPSTVTLLCNLGLGLANTYYSAKKKFPINIILGNSILYSIIVGISLIIVITIGFEIGLLKPYLKIEEKYFLSAIWTIPILLMSNFFISILQGLGNIIKCNIINFARAVFFLILLIIALFLFGTNIQSVILIWSISWIITVIMGYFDITKITKSKIGFSLSVFKESLSYGLKGYPANIFSFLNYRLDMFLINYFLGDYQLGLYFGAVLFAETLWFLPNAVGFVLFPKTATQDKEQSVNLTEKITRLIGTVVIPFGLGLIALFYICIHIFIPKYAGSFIPFLILLPGIVIFSMDMIVSNYFLGEGKQLYNSIGAGLMCILNVILNFILIPKWGINGAAFVSSITYIFGTIYSFIVFKKLTGEKITSLLFLQKSDYKDVRDAIKSLKDEIK